MLTCTCTCSSVSPLPTSTYLVVWISIGIRARLVSVDCMIDMVCVVFIILNLSQRYSDFVDNNIDSAFCGWFFRDCNHYNYAVLYSGLCMFLSLSLSFFLLSVSVFFSHLPSSLSPLSLFLSFSLSLPLLPLTLHLSYYHCIYKQFISQPQEE